MIDPEAPHDDVSGGRYEIRVKGRLDARWSTHLEGMRLTHEGDGLTVIHCPDFDQAALHGLLRIVRDLGISLVSVSHIPGTTSGDPA